MSTTLRLLAVLAVVSSSIRVATVSGATFSDDFSVSHANNPTQAQFESFTLVIVPEPGTATLICGGLAVGLVALLKRRRLHRE
jgi:hypothetical protein